jgi:hypothetical protein
VELALVPPAAPATRAAVLAALTAAGVDLAPEPDRYQSPWRTAALTEGVDRSAPDAGEPRYALSPRSTRGATRA